MSSPLAVLVFVLASFWCLPEASSHSSLKIAVKFGNSILNVNLKAPEFKRFYTCMCANNPLQSTCNARIGNVNLIINFDSWFHYLVGSPNCTQVKEIFNFMEIRINYVLRNVQCSGSSAGRYIHIRSNAVRCLSDCAAFLFHEAPLSQQARDIFLNGGACATSCCEIIFGVSTTSSAVLTARRTTTAAAVSSGATNYITLTTSTGSNNQHQMYSNGIDVTVLIISLITALLALTAIIISSVVCRRYVVRTRSKKETVVSALLRSVRDPVRGAAAAEQPSNVYSDLSRNNAGSIHRYADLTTRGNVECGRSTRNGAYAREEGSKGQTTCPIYDDVIDNDTGYIQVTED